jgi:hypothetical protein
MNGVNLQRSPVIKKIQQEANIKFTVKMKKIANEAFNLLRKAYADDSRVTYVLKSLFAPDDYNTRRTCLTTWLNLTTWQPTARAREKLDSY